VTDSLSLAPKSANPLSAARVTTLRINNNFAPAVTPFREIAIPGGLAFVVRGDGRSTGRLAAVYPHVGKVTTALIVTSVP
jgi:hypothetical protein